MSKNQENKTLELSNLYFSKEAAKRLAIYQYLGELALTRVEFSVPVIKLLMKALIEKDKTLQIHGIYYLGEIGSLFPWLSEHVIYPFIVLLLSPDLDRVVEFYVLNALEKINKDSEEVKEFLYRGITDIAYTHVAKLSFHNPEERYMAVWRIGKLGTINFSAILDLIPILLNHLVDEDDQVINITFKVVSDFIIAKNNPMLKLILENLNNIDNIFLKIKIYELLENSIKFEPLLVEKIIPHIFPALKHPNRQIYIKIHKLLKTSEKVSPTYFIKHEDLLVDALKSESRYAYHWAVKAFTTTVLTYFKERSNISKLVFIDEVTSLINLLTKNNQDKMMQTRIVLMMLLHEVIEILSKNGLPTSVSEGIIEGLNQIQKSDLESNTEIISAFEKFKTILNNSKIFLS